MIADGRAGPPGAGAGPLVCCIGTTDPWNAAGLGLDVATVTALGARAAVVVAAVSAQDDGGLRGLWPMPADAVSAQLTSLARAPVAAYRIGALAGTAVVDAVASGLSAGVPCVLDPVLGPSAGGAFADEATLRALVTRLFPRMSLVTPNRMEAARLLGSGPVETVEAASDAARALVRLGAGAALVTGGDAPGDRAVDVLCDGDGVAVLDAPRVAASLRGTGCLLAAASAVALARGEPLRDAIASARRFVRERIAAGRQLGPMRAAF